MASRKEEKEQLRQHRLAKQQADEQRARRLRRRGYLVAGVLGAAALAAVAAVIATGGGGGGESKASAAPFGQHYDRLDSRMKQADVPTMMDTMGSTSHFHPQLRIYINGKQMKVPANIGIDPGKDSMAMAGLHTHDTSGTIHDEGMDHSTLGQFFMVWGVKLSPTQLGPYRNTKRKKVKMWVDDKPSKAFGSLDLKDGQQIVIAYGTKVHEPV